MKKPIIVTAAIFIVLIVVLIFIQSLLKKNNATIVKVLPSPTLIVPESNTLNTGSTAPNDTAPKNAAPTEEAFEKINDPGLFLSNKTPYTNEFFSISYTFKNAPTGHFAFTVDLKGDKNASQTQVIVWLKSLGLQTSQISSLDITYR